MLTGMVFIVQDCAFRWGLVGLGKAMQEGWQRSQPPAAGGTCGAAAFGRARARANAPRARAPTRRRRRPRPPELGAPWRGRSTGGENLLVYSAQRCGLQAGQSRPVA